MNENVNYPEVKLRNLKFIEAVKQIKLLNESVTELCEYPEFNVLLMAIKDMEESFRDRLTSMAKATDKNLLTRLNQFDSILK